jgi:DNA-binding CsgD family transcriptional regulator
MIHEAKLIRTAEKVTSYVENYVSLVGVEKKEEVFNLFNTMHQLFPQWVIFSCPMMHPEIHYASKNVSHVLGHSERFMLANARLEKFIHLVHPEDQEDLYECVSHTHDLLSSVPPEDHPLYRAVFQYRMRNAEGKFMFIHDEKATLSLRGGNLYYVIVRNITEERSFSGVKLEIYKQEESLKKIKEVFPKRDKNPISKREKELVALLKQGFSTKEIGTYLNISHNTVRNIKSKLFEKYNVNNSIELLNLVP